MLTAYLLGQDGTQYYLAERQDEVLLSKYGRHLFDYDGGLDNNVDPPPDGTYQVVASAQDAVGQVVQRTSSLTIEDGGKPYAQIIPQTTGATVVFEQRPWEDRFPDHARSSGRPDRAARRPGVAVDEHDSDDGRRSAGLQADGRELRQSADPHDRTRARHGLRMGSARLDAWACPRKRARGASASTARLRLATTPGAGRWATIRRSRPPSTRSTATPITICPPGRARSCGARCA